MTTVDADTFAWAILNKFNQLSRRRFYNLAFLIEHEYYTTHNERVTDTDYREFLSGMYNEELEDALENSQRLDFEKTKVAGEEFDVIIVPVTQVQTIPEDLETILETVIEDFAEEDSETLVNNVKARIPREVNITTVLDFDALYEDALPLYKRLNRE